MRKKADYQKQRRHSYGAAPHAARKAIPRAKQRQNQRERRGVRAELSRGDADAAEEIPVRGRVRRSFKKVPDEPLGRVLMLRTVRQFVRRKITAATFRRKIQRLREQYSSFVPEYRAFVHGYSHVPLDADIRSVLAEFR